MDFKSLLSWTASFSQPFLRVLIPSAGAAYGLQALVAIISVLVASERFYDISGSLAFITATLLSMYLPIMQARAVAAMTATIPKPGYPRILGFLGSALGQNDFSVRKLAVNAAVIVWAMRCKFAPPVSFQISSCARRGYGGQLHPHLVEIERLPRGLLKQSLPISP
jgi:hypothetical protein